MTERQEKKHELTAFITSVVIHGVAFLLMFFIVAWRTPDPPYGAGEPGVEINLGTDDQGSGDIQPDEPVGTGGTQQEAPQNVEAPKAEPQPPETKEVEEKLLTSEEDDAPAVVKEEKKKEVKPEVPKEKPEVKPKEEPKKEEPKKEEPKKEEVKPKETPKAVYNPNAQSSTSDNKSTDGKAGKPGNQGDDVDKVGDKGKPGGVDKSAIYDGTPGSGGGGGGTGSGGVSMSGFNGFEWPKVQQPSLPDEAYGVYEFVVKVDDQGDVISVTPVKRGLSLEAERKLKEVIQKLVFIPKGTNLPPQSEGRITFRIVSR